MQTTLGAISFWQSGSRRPWPGYHYAGRLSSWHKTAVPVNVGCRRGVPACRVGPHSISSRQAAMCEYCIRPAAPTDVTRVASIELSCKQSSAGWNEGMIQDELNKEHAKVLVAASTQSDEALGYIVGWLIAGELQVLELAVDPSQQSKGIGTALLCALLQQCRCDDAVEAVLEVKESNAKAIRLYERHGFGRVGLRRNYYADGTAAVLMARSP